MNQDDDQSMPNPMHHPEEPPTGAEGSPKFGRLLIVLAVAVILIGLITVASEAYFSH